MENLPLAVYAGFVFTTGLTLFFLYKASRYSKVVLLISFTWLGLQAALGLSKFYTVAGGLPPRFALALFPPLVFMIILSVTKKGRAFIAGFNTKWLTLLHVVRLPVEAALLWLALHKYVPQLMTVEGRNFDVLSGLTAPFIFYFGYIRKSLNRTFLLIWNFSCLALLINVVVIAVLSAPLPFQQFSFDQPNVAVLYFPFVWLPSFIVPVVLFSHLASIRHLLKHNAVAASAPTAAYTAA